MSTMLFEVPASLTDQCDGGVRLTADPGSGHVKLTACGADLLGGPPDDGDPAPNSGTVIGLTPAEALELAQVLTAAARRC